MRLIFTYKKLYKAYLDCRRSKRKTANALKFEYAMEENLLDLLCELQSRTYAPGRSICFIVTEPKPREIFAADFRDRIVHHLFVGELLPFAEKTFIHDSFACRKGKGTHKAVEKVRKFIKSAENRKKDISYMQLDIKTFFPSIDRAILHRLTEKLIRKAGKDEEWTDGMLWLARTIIFHDAASDFYYKGDPALKTLVPTGKSLTSQKPGKGLPIGNYTSQFFANLYLNEIDQYIKRILKTEYYVRYVDDLVIIGFADTAFDTLQKSIDGFLRDNLELELNAKKSRISPIKSGMDFLGYYIKEDYVLVRRKVLKRMNAKLYDKKLGKDKKMQSISSYFAHFKHADSWKLRSKIVENQIFYAYWPEFLSCAARRP